MKKIVCISDTHTQHNKIKMPKGDILIYCGDAELRTMCDYEDFYSWISSQKYKHKCLIAGNHDLFAQYYGYELMKNIFGKVHYLFENFIEIDGIKIWGAPWTPIFLNWAFMLPYEDRKRVWSKIPEDVDVIVTHGPPLGIMDEGKDGHVGCEALRDRIKEIKPKYHIFGHIHEGYGIYFDGNTTYVNCSVLDGFYKYTNEPIVLEI